MFSKGFLYSGNARRGLVARTLTGLFFKEAIPVEVDFAPAQDYLDMMERLRSTINSSPEQVSELKATYNFDGHNLN